MLDKEAIQEKKKKNEKIKRTLGKKSKQVKFDKLSHEEAWIVSHINGI